MHTLAALARSGVSADAVTAVAPASTYPAHATLASGRSPAGHGIVADRRLGERGVRETRFSHASQLRAPTLWQIATEAGRSVAALGATAPALLEVAQARGAGRPDADAPGPARDAVLVGVACDLLGGPTSPRLILLRLGQVAPAIDLFGPGSSEVAAGLEGVDREIDRLLGCLAAAGRLEGAALVFVGDHGAVPVHTELAPNTVLAGEGLVTTQDGAVSGWRAVARSNGGSAFVYARDDRAAARARRALADEAVRSAAFRVVSAEEMIAIGADPEAWFGLEAEPGFAFDDRAAGPALRAAAWRGRGGYLPRHVEMVAGFVAWGRGIRRGIRIPRMHQTDVAPTLARLLGVELEGTEGRVLVGALRLDEGPDEASSEAESEVGEGGG
jgi:predicted AlkP superfamily pyrophosphatase or phosphodiesterase